MTNRAEQNWPGGEVVEIVSEPTAGTSALAAASFRPYTSDDYVNNVPCIYRWRGSMETVFPISVGGAHPFDGSRLLTFRFSNGYVTSRNVDGSDLTTVLYAMTTSR